MSDRVVYDFGRIESLASDINTRKTSLISAHDELKGYVQGLVSQWEGSAQEAYRAKQSQWDNAHNELLNVLGTIVHAVQEGNQGMGTTENSNASGWA